MLNHLTIKYFAIIEHSEIAFDSGMTTITGQTGAGKSILMQALNFVCGARLDKTILHPKKSTEVSAIIEIDTIDSARQWLEQNDIDSEDNTLVLRRVATPSGKSKAFVNGSIVTLAQLKTLAPLIVSFYGQHAHHHLYKTDNQLAWLDAYHGKEALQQTLKSLYQQHQSIANEIDQLQQKAQEQANQQALLTYQYNELASLEIKEGEFEQLEDEHTKLSNADQWLENCARLKAALYEGEQNASSLIGQHHSLLTSMIDASQDNHLKQADDFIEQASVYIKEAYEEIINYESSLSQDPERLNDLDRRIADYFDAARKHNVLPQALYSHFIDIQSQLSECDDVQTQLNDLEQQLEQVAHQYHQTAKQLSKVRGQVAKPFAEAIEEKIHLLNIPQGRFRVVVDRDNEKIAATGYDRCHFQICFNPGQPYADLSSIASGGELSRIGLAIQTITTEKSAPPILIFDEVDVGISGATAETVGLLLKQLSGNAQVICITHQAQVAVQGHQQCHVRKYFDDQHCKTYSEVSLLTPAERIEEIAKITGGIEMTQSNLDHAKAMYQQHHS